VNIELAVEGINLLEDTVTIIGEVFYSPYSPQSDVLPGRARTGRKAQRFGSLNQLC